MRSVCCLFVIGMSLAFAGCGSQDGGQAVHGTVLMDGAPLAKGAIMFTPIDAKGDAASGEILNGKYSIPAAAGPHPGSHRVEIRALRKSGKMAQKPFAPEGEMVESDEEAIAFEFNSESKLKHDIKAGGNQADFQVNGRSKE